MANIRVDKRIMSNVSGEDLIAVIQSLIHTELKKPESEVDADFVEECVNAILEIEQSLDNAFVPLVPLVKRQQFIDRVMGNNHTWRSLSKFARVAIVAATLAGSTFTANAAVEAVTGVNLLREAGSVVQTTLENWGVINRTGIDIIDGQDDDGDEIIIVETTTKPKETTTEEAVTETTTIKNETTKIKSTTTTARHIDFIDGEDDDDETTTKKTTRPTTTKRPTTTNKAVPPTTEKAPVAPTPSQDIKFISLSAEFDNFKTDYIYGEELSYEGLTLKANYSDGSFEIVELSDCNYTKNIDMNVTADYELHIIYNNSTVTINITVRPDEETRGSMICHNELYDYLLCENGAYITAYRGNETELFLDYVDSNKVAAFGASLFKDSDIKSVTARNLIKIFDSAFEGCTSLISCNTPNVEYIGKSAFDGCTHLSALSYSDYLEYLGKSALRDTALREIKIPDGISEISDYLCENCAQLETVKLMGRVTKIGTAAFSKCEKLTSISGVADIVEVGAFAFSDDTNLNFDERADSIEIVGRYSFSKCNSLDIGTLPRLKKFDTGSFEYCYLMTKVTISSEMTVIPNSAFSGTRLSEITLHNGITEIGDYAFMSTMLTKVNLPLSVEKIGTRAFYTTRLRQVYFTNERVFIDDDAFFAGTRLTFYVKDGSTAMEYAQKNDITYELI